MVENNFKMSDEQQLRNLDKQTVFKRPAEVGAASSAGTSIGLHENIAGSLAYLLGFFSGFVLLLIERENRFVRFHAFQSIYISIAFLSVYFLMGMLPIVGWLSGVILSPIGLVLWIILMLNAYNGKYSKIIYIGEFAEKKVH